VDKAEDTKTGELVTIKQEKPIFDDILDAKRMLSKISILRTMNYPAIIQMKDLIVDAENPNDDSTIFVRAKSQNQRRQPTLLHLRKCLRQHSNLSQPRHLKQ
jgi:hypothetical protein